MINLLNYNLFAIYYNHLIVITLIILSFESSYLFLITCFQNFVQFQPFTKEFLLNFDKYFN